MNRAEHLEWAKERALQYVDTGDVNQALASLHSDLMKHPDLAQHPGIDLGFMQQMSGLLTAPGDVRDWIKGFN